MDGCHGGRRHGKMAVGGGRGCIPIRAWRRSATLGHAITGADRYAGAIEGAPCWSERISLREYLAAIEAYALFIADFCR
jgi:hypothetical protein